MIESGFMPDAYFVRCGWRMAIHVADRSRDGARVDDWVDERRHIRVYALGGEAVKASL